MVGCGLPQNAKCTYCIRGLWRRHRNVNQIPEDIRTLSSVQTWSSERTSNARPGTAVQTTTRPSLRHLSPTVPWCLEISYAHHPDYHSPKWLSSAWCRRAECIPHDTLQGKVWLTAGIEFGAEQGGKNLLVVRALYGLKSASASFWAYMAKKLDDMMGFKSSVADPDVWLRRRGVHLKRHLCGSWLLLYFYLRILCFWVQNPTIW
jgi:hypothetical protein